MATTLAFYIWGAHWRHLKNTTEMSMCGGDVALCQITFTTCYNYLMAFFQDNLRKLAPFWILLDQEMMGWHCISCTICKSFAPRCRERHASTSPLSFFTGRMLFLPSNQQRQITEGSNYHNRKRTCN